MASAVRDKLGWIAIFRPLFGSGDAGRRPVRIPPSRLVSLDDKAGADAYARHLAQLCRLCEVAPSVPTIDEAETLGAITAEQAAALRSGKQPPSARPAPDQRLTILAAALAHPSSQREKPAEQERHRKEVQRFVDHARIERVQDMTLEVVMSYLDHLRAEGMRFDGRRHALLWLRRASKMAAAAGLPDPLSGMSLDHRERRGAIVVWTLPQILAAVQALQAVPDRRPLAVLLLGACCGLRDSEIIRREVRDLQGDRLDCATDPSREAKNDASRRMLPLAPVVADVLAGLAAGRQPSEALIATASQRSHGSQSPGFFNAESFATWFRRCMWPDEGRRARGYIDAGLPPLPPKTMRKSFMSWMARGKANRDHLERYTGHTLSGVARVTGRHYLADYAADELQGIADLIQAQLAPVYTKPYTAA